MASKNHLAAYAFLLLAFAVSSLAFPASPALPHVQTYDQLVHAIRGVRAASEKRIEQAVGQEKIREAWEIGKLIDAHMLQHKQRADYGEQVIIKLAKDLGTSETELKYMLQFARTYPIRPAPDELSWSHYRELLSLNDSKEREEVTQQAVRERWSSGQVRQEVRRRQAARNPSQEKAPEPVLTATPGKVGIYRVVKASAGPYEGQLALDLGFSNYFQPDKISQFKEGDLVKWDGGARSPRPGEETSPLQKMPNATLADLFTYNAYVTEIIDGDTFKAVIDLGFKIVTEQRLRLRALDAPEIESAEGREAKAFLAQELAKSTGPVLIKTVKSDKYDRYLADVWVGETYVNQKLIGEGLAVKVNE